MPRAGNRAPPSLISFHQDCVGHTCIAWLLSSGPFQREGHLSWLSSPSYILCQVWAYFLSLLSLLSRMQNASSSVQNGKYQRKSQNYPSVPESDLLGPFFFSFFHSLLIRDSWFLTSWSSQLRQYPDYLFGNVTSGHVFSSHPLFPLSVLLLSLVSDQPHESPL